MSARRSAFTLGAACLHLVVFAILTLHLAYWPVFLALLVSVIAAAVATGAWTLEAYWESRSRSI